MLVLAFLGINQHSDTWSI